MQDTSLACRTGVMRAGHTSCVYTACEENRAFGWECDECGYVNM